MHERNARFKTYESGSGHVRNNNVVDGKTLGPEVAFGMVRVLLDLSEIRSEMAGVSNDSSAYQLQCAQSHQKPSPEKAIKNRGKHLVF